MPGIASHFEKGLRTATEQEAVEDLLVLRALDSRLNNPWTIHGGFTVPQMLDRLAQARVEVELEPKGGASTTKRPNTDGGHEIK
jgi:hypothetical protein